MGKQTLIVVHLFLVINFKKSEIMKKFILYSFLLFGLSLSSQNQSTLNISETEKQEMISQLEEMKTSFYSKVKSKYSRNLGESDKNELVQLYSDFNREWDSKINSFSRKYNTEPKVIVTFFNNEESKMNCKH